MTGQYRSITNIIIKGREHFGPSSKNVLVKHLVTSANEFSSSPVVLVAWAG
jgi:hypothetical protein